MDGLTLGSNPAASAASTALAGAVSAQQGGAVQGVGAGQGDAAGAAAVQSSMQERGIGQKLDAVV